MNIKKRKAIVVALSTLVVAASVAIPVGIVYGNRSTTSSTANTPDVVTIVKKDPLPTAYRFGTDEKATIPVPPLAPDGYTVDPNDYASGVASPLENITTLKAGEMTTITFTYEPKIKGSGPTFKITYPLNTQKGTTQGFGLNNSGTDDLAKEIYYSTVETFKQLEEQQLEGGVEKWLKAHYNAYKFIPLSSTDPKIDSNPKYVKEDGSKLEEAELKTFGANKKFEGTYKFVFNEDQFEKKTPSGADAKPEGTLRVTYTVRPLKLASVTSPKYATATTTLEYGTDFVLPTDPGDAGKEQHYVLKAGSPVAIVKVRPDGATKAPAVNAAVDPAKVKEYESGTEFEVTYTYTKESENYEGNDYQYIVKYKIADKALAKPTYTAMLTQDIEFGASSDAQKSPPLDLEHFTAKLVSAKVTRKSTVTPKGTLLSPDQGEDVAWDKVSSYNSGTRYKVVFEYTADKYYQYTGEPIIVEKEFNITKKSISTPKYDFRNLNQSEYAYSADPATLVKPVPENGFILSPNVVYYRTGAQPKSADTPIDAAQVRSIPFGEKFVAEWTATLDTDNYVTTSTTAEYKIAIPYEVGKKPAKYDSTNLSYGGVPIRFGDDLPSDFEPKIPTLPDADKNEGYKYDSVSYQLTKMADDNSGPKLNAPIQDLTAIKYYAAGTVITASFKFVPDNNHSGLPIFVTKTITIGKKIVAQPAATRAEPPQSIVWGNTRTRPTAPAAPEGYKAGTYSAEFTAKPATGTPADLSETVDWTKLSTYGAGTVIKVTWTYQPDSINFEAATGSLTPVTVTQEYTITRALTVEPAGLDQPAENNYKAADVIVYSPKNTSGTGALAFPSTATAPDPTTFKATGYGAGTLVSVKVSKDNGSNTPGEGTDVNTFTQANAFDTGSEFEAIYKYEPDANHTGDTIFYIVTYRSDAKPAVRPTTGVTEAPPGTFRPIANTVYDPVNPPAQPTTDNAPTLGTGYKGALDSIKVSKVPTGGTKTPPRGQVISSWSAPAGFDNGAEFEVRYNYAPDAGYSGDPFTYIVTYVVTYRANTQPTPAQISAAMAVKDSEFGLFNLANPFPAPNFANFVGTIREAKVTTASTGPTTANDITVPVNTLVKAPYTDLNKYNSGTVISVTYDYAPAPGYTGTPFSGTKQYRIVQQRITAYKQETNWTGNPINFSKTLDQPSKMIGEPLNDPIRLYFNNNECIWYVGPSSPGAFTKKLPNNILDAPKQPVGTTLTVTFRYWFGPTKAFHNYVGVNPNGTTFYTFVVEKTFTIIA